MNKCLLDPIDGDIAHNDYSRQEDRIVCNIEKANITGIQYTVRYIKFDKPMEELGERSGSVTRKRFCLDDMVTPMKLIRSVTPQSSFVLFWVFASIYIMNLFNAFVYSRLPTEGPLPDIIADAYKPFGQLRANPSYMGKQPADMMSFFLAASMLLATILFFDRVNARKLGVVYCICLHLRTFFFSVTGLPPTCIGYPNCPCAVTPYRKVAQEYSLPMMAAIYSFAVGLFLDRFPQCGDLTMSGHTIYIWVCALYFLDIMEKVFQGFVLMLMKAVIYTMVILVTVTIILIRNHYTIDIVMATVFTNMVWSGYTWCQYLLRMGYKPFLNTYAGRFVKWVEFATDADDANEVHNHEH